MQRVAAWFGEVSQLRRVALLALVAATVGNFFSLLPRSLMVVSQAEADRALLGRPWSEDVAVGPSHAQAGPDNPQGVYEDDVGMHEIGPCIFSVSVHHGYRSSFQYGGEWHSGDRQCPVYCDPASVVSARSLGDPNSDPRRARFEYRADAAGRTHQYRCTVYREDDERASRATTTYSLRSAPTKMHALLSEPRVAARTFLRQSAAFQLRAGAFLVFELAALGALVPAGTLARLPAPRAKGARRRWRLLQWRSVLAATLASLLAVALASRWTG